MSAAALLNSSGQIAPDFLGPAANLALATPIVQSSGAVAAPLTGTFTCTQSGIYIMQLYILVGGTSAAVGTGSCTLTYTGNDGWGVQTIPVAQIVGGGNILTQVLIGYIPAGVQTFTFTPTTGMNLGSIGEVAVRVVKGLV